jgi:3-ketosteroid 9alpha-monooxygenase subunit B
MSVFTRLRYYHLAIGAFALAAYLSEDLTGLHRSIGYCLAGLLAARILLFAGGLKILPQPAWHLRKSDHQPKHGLANPIISKSFIAGIMLSLALTITTGILLDQSRTNDTMLTFISTAQADDHGRSKKPKGNKVLKGIHESSANSMLILVGLHVAYLLLMRRDYALRMIFITRGA